MTMTRLKISKTLLAVMLTSAVATGSAYAENNAQTTNESAGQKVDSSMNKVGNFMDDSAITAKVKAALVDHDNIKSTDISVKTDQKVVTLSGFVESQAQAEEAGAPGSFQAFDANICQWQNVKIMARNASSSTGNSTTPTLF